MYVFIETRPTNKTLHNNKIEANEWEQVENTKEELINDPVGLKG